MTTGTIKWINESRGFGLITPDTGANAVFARFKGGSKPPAPKQKVCFDIAAGPDGEYAVNVKSIA